MIVHVSSRFHCLAMLDSFSSKIGFYNVPMQIVLFFFDEWCVVGNSFENDGMIWKDVSLETYSFVARFVRWKMPLILFGAVMLPRHL